MVIKKRLMCTLIIVLLVTLPIAQAICINPIEIEQKFTENFNKQFGNDKELTDEELYRGMQATYKLLIRDLISPEVYILTTQALNKIPNIEFSERTKMLHTAVQALLLLTQDNNIKLSPEFIARVFSNVNNNEELKKKIEIYSEADENTISKISANEALQDLIPEKSITEKSFAEKISSHIQDNSAKLGENNVQQLLNPEAGTTLKEIPTFIASLAVGIGLGSLFGIMGVAVTVPVSIIIWHRLTFGKQKSQPTEKQQTEKKKTPIETIKPEHFVFNLQGNFGIKGAAVNYLSKNNIENILESWQEGMDRPPELQSLDKKIGNYKFGKSIVYKDQLAIYKPLFWQKQFQIHHSDGLEELLKKYNTAQQSIVDSKRTVLNSQGFQFTYDVKQKKIILFSVDSFVTLAQRKKYANQLPNSQLAEQIQSMLSAIDPEILSELHTIHVKGLSSLVEQPLQSIILNIKIGHENKQLAVLEG